MLDEVFKVLQPLGEVLPTGKKLEDVFREIYNGIEGINYRFVSARERVVEFSKSIGDAIPLVEKLGGEAADVTMVIDKVAAATRRNVVASAEEIENLFAAQQLTATDAQVLVDKFQNVGVSFSQIGGQLETSIKYIQSVGGNARDIMQQVNGIVENINKYNFQDGVLGLTRMATQAQLLKFDMNQTLTLAEKALSPEGAIELASAFQRMGVSVGELTDPFQLMNKALTDPEGLQNSLVEMTKQYTYFDEKTKTFKINPEGMLMLREIGQQTGLNSAELSKMAVNAADVGAKLSQISPSFEFENEEDKQYIANIAKMGKGGEYEITVKDEVTGEDKTVLLQEASNKELKELVERQRASTQDLSLVELQKSQIDMLTALTGELKSTRDAYSVGIATNKDIVKFLTGNVGRESVVGGAKEFVEKYNLSTTPDTMREQTGKAIKDISSFAKDLLTENGKNFKNSIEEFLKPLKKGLEEAVAPLSEIISRRIEEYKDKDKKASGGYVYGEGTSTSDSIPALLSNGEFVVNAASTASFGPLLETINKNPNYDIKEITSPGLELKNTNDVTASSMTNRSITELISSFNTTKTNTETKTSRVEFGEISPIKVIFEKGPGFSENDMAMLEYNLGKGNITEQLTKSLSENLKVLQLKEV
jgi:hypothetical protein